MVKITDFNLRNSHEGEPFYVLILQGGVEIVKSTAGKMYATMRKVSIPTTFDEITCQSLIGTELPGSIARIECEAYEYTIPETGEIVFLTHRFDYVEEAQPVSTDFTKIYKHSNNGVKQEA